MRVEETERLFEVMQVNVIKHEGNGIDVMGVFIARIGLGSRRSLK